MKRVGVANVSAKTWRKRSITIVEVALLVCYLCHGGGTLLMTVAVAAGLAVLGSILRGDGRMAVVALIAIGALGMPVLLAASALGGHPLS